MLLEAERTQIILWTAADKIRQRGLARGGFGTSATGPVCTAGAIKVAINGMHDWLGGVPMEHFRLYFRAVEAVARHLDETGESVISDDYWLPRGLYDWNDARCRDAEHAISALRETADNLL